MPARARISRHLDLYSYWLSKRGARIMPARGDINPADIPRLLPHLLIVERAGDQFRYRLVGSAIAQGVGYAVTGTIVGSSVFEPDAAAKVRAIFGRVFTAATPVFSAGQYIHKTGAGIELSLLTAPLSEDGRVVNMSISTLAVCFSGAQAPEPGWLRGLPANMGDVIEVRDTMQLETLCCQWGERCLTRPEMQRLPG
jgi:hypothetical protein